MGLRKRGSSSRQRSMWRETYERTPYTELPWFDIEPSPPVVRAVAEGFIPAAAAVLDLGCGAGSNVLYLARHGFEAHGVDISPGAIRAATDRAGREHLSADFQVGDALDLSFTAGRFGAVTDNGCFHTLPTSRRTEYAREVARVLRPDGSLVLAWVAREHVGPLGPRHRPSLEEVAKAFEPTFQFLRTEFRPPRPEAALAMYDAWLRKRRGPQPPRR